MNKLYIENDVIKKEKLDSKITLLVEEKNELFTVNRMILQIVDDTTLWIDFDMIEESKLEVFIKVAPSVHVTIYELHKGQKLKIQYQYELEEYASVVVHKFYCSKQAREYDIVHLNGRNACFNQVVKTIATRKEKYDMVVYHNAEKTESNLVNHGVAVEEGSIIFNVTSVVPQGKKECNVNQQNRIITTNQEECKISPNLLIDEYDVSANHAALIGKFQEDEIFYLQSRGIEKKTAIEILTKGFLCSFITNEMLLKEIEDKITQYWR